MSFPARVVHTDSGEPIASLLWLGVRLAVPLLLALGPRTAAGDQQAPGLPTAAFLGQASVRTRQGHARLEWSGSQPDLLYHLQSSRDAAFSDPLERYRGRETASFLSGLGDGTHHFRVRARREASARWGPWSELVTVEVRHQSMTLAWALFGVGGLLFLLTAGFILYHAHPWRSGASDDG